MESPFLIGDWLVEPQLNKVVGPAGSLTIEPRTMKVLVHLALKKPDVVTREQLMDVVWEDSVVTEHSLTIAISDLRKIFGDDPKTPAVIETIRGVGYRLIAPVIENPTSIDQSISQLTMQTPTLSVPHHGDGMAGTYTKPTKKLPGAAIWATLVASLVVFLIWSFLFWPEDEAFVIHKIQPFTTMSGVEISPAFSPDSRRVAFVVFPDSGDISHIFVQQLGATEPVRLTEERGAELFPTWSPDGQHIVYLGYADECALYKKPSFGGAGVKLRDIDCRLAGMSWSNDGETLIVSAYDELQSVRKLFRMTLSDYSMTPVTSPSSAIIGDVGPRFSPDGNTLAFLRTVDEATKDIYLLDWNNPSVEPQRLTYDDANITGFDWTADGRAIVFASGRESNSGLWRIALESDDEPTLIRAVSVDDPGSVILARSGKQLIYTDWTYEINTWRMPVSSETDTTLQPAIMSTRADFHPDISVRNKVAYISTRTGSHEVWVADPDGSNPVRITNLNNRATFYPAWSPDGKQIAFESRLDEQSDIYIVDAAGGLSQRFTMSDAQDSRPSWSKDGRFVYFGSDRSGAWQIWKQPVSGGEAVQVTTNGGMAGWETKAGEALLFLKADTSGIWEMKMKEQEEQLLIKADPSFVTVTDQNVFYIHPPMTASQHTIMRYDLNSLETEKIANIPFRPLHYFSRWGFAVSPDERWIYFSQVDKSESDLMLTEGVL